MMDSELLFPKMPSIGTARLFLAIAVAAGILSGAAGGQLLCDGIAAVTGSVALLSLPRPSIGKFIRNSLLLGLFSLIGAEAATFLASLIQAELTSQPDPSGQFAFYCVAALTPALCCIAICLSIYKLRSRGVTVATVTLILLGMLALTQIALFLDTGGSLSLASLKEMLAGFDADLRTMFDEALRMQADGTSSLLDRATLDRMIRIVEFLLPFMFYAFCFAAAYAVTGLIRRILMGYTLGRRSLGDWLIVPSKISCICNMISCVFCIFTINFLFSEDSTGIGAGGILSLTAIALLLLTLPGCFAVGVRRTVFLFRTRRGFGLMGIIIALFVGMMIPFFLFFYFGFVGAYHTVFDPIIAKKLREMENMNGGDPPHDDPSDPNDSNRF